MTKTKLSSAQEKALERITACGRQGVGVFGGIRRSTTYALVKLGLVECKHEYVRGNLREYAYPKGS